MVDNFTIFSDTSGKNFFVSFTIFFKNFHCSGFLKLNKITEQLRWPPELF